LGLRARETVACLITFAASLALAAGESPNIQAGSMVDSGECEPVSSVAVESGVAVLATGSRLTMLDLSGAGSVIGRSNELPAAIQDVAMTGSLVFAALGDAGLAIFDVTDPAYPKMLNFFEGHRSTVGGVAAVEGVADRVAVHKNYAFFLGDPIRTMQGNPTQLQIIDVSDVETPFSPLEESGLVGGEAYDIAFGDDAVYVTGYMPLLTILDVSNPVDPRRAGDFSVGRAAALSIAAGDELVYLINEFSQSLDILDVSDPAMPLRIASYRRPDLWPPPIEPPARMLSRTPDGHVVSLSWRPRHEGYNVVAFDVSEPTEPIEVGSYSYTVSAGPVPGRIRASAGASALYVAAGKYGLHVVDVSDAASPVLAQTFCF